LTVPTLPPSTPGPTTITPTAIDPVVLLRVSIVGEVTGPGWTPDLSVYADGNVIRPEPEGHRVVSRLGAGGLAALLEVVDDSGLVEKDGFISWKPSYVGGFTTYGIEVRRGDKIIKQSTVDAAIALDRPAAERLIALVERLIDLEHLLPADAWTIAPGAATPFVPSLLLAKITRFDRPYLAGADELLDVGSVPWPLEGRLLDFGDEVAGPPMGAGTSSRCAPISLDDAVKIQAALAAAPWRDADGEVASSIPEATWMTAVFSTQDRAGHVYVSLVNLLPDEDDCSSGPGWP